MTRLLLACLLALAPLAGCDSGTGDDAPDPIDATPGDGSGSSIDGAPACTLPSATISCTVGNDAPCTSVCAQAYCYNFNQVGSLCTSACTPGDDSACPSGWTCNNMGRCRPPG